MLQNIGNSCTSQSIGDGCHRRHLGFYNSNKFAFLALVPCSWSQTEQLACRRAEVASEIIEVSRSSLESLQFQSANYNWKDYNTNLVDVQALLKEIDTFLELRVGKEEW